MPRPRLLIRLGSLGDVVLATATANAERHALGDACLDVLVKAEYADLWRGHPAVREILVWRKDERGALRAWGARLRKRRYEEALDLQSSLRTRIVTALAGIRRVRRPRRYGLRRRLLVLTKRMGPPKDYRVLESFVAVAAPGAVALPSLHPLPEARARAASVLPVLGGVGLVPGAKHATKRWPLERFVEAGRRLAAERLGPVVVFFGPEDDSVRDLFETSWPRRQGGWTEVREPLPVVAACMERLAAVVSGDTGLLHMAAAVGTPGVALFGPTVRSFGFEPCGEGHAVLEVALACRPCSVHGGPTCPLGHHRCLRDIPVERVLEALRDTRLAARGSS